MKKYLLLLLLPVLSATPDTENEEEIFDLAPFTLSEGPESIEQYIEELEDYGLERLTEKNCVRFLWLRWRNVPMLFEVYDEEETVDVVAKTFEHDLWKVWKTRSVDRSVHFDVLKQIEEDYKFFEMPFRLEDQGDDASEWFIEVNYKDHSHVVYRRSPNKETKFFELGFMIIESMIESPLSPIH
ncbi:hypothetical protein VDG1235_569 [Verrucomicrobiia bacterium DG1235]|nr:hypothetical protein VDG1235_569 [Verrucomicrobiae bacterium DG1235]